MEPVIFLNGLEGMAIGAIDPIIITNDTPIDLSQWEDGKPWHIRVEGQKWNLPKRS